MQNNLKIMPNDLQNTDVQLIRMNRLSSGLMAVRSRNCSPWFAGIAMLWFCAMTAFGGQLTAVIEPDEILMGESARLTLNFENVRPTELPAIPEIPNLQISYVGSGQTFQFVNGRQTTIVSLNYVIVPGQPGEYTIPTIRAKVGNETLSSSPVKLKVLKEGDSGGDTEARGRLAFMKLVPAKTNVYVGEVLPLEIQLYHAVPAQDLQLQPFSGEGFTFGKNRELPQRRVRIGNTTYFLRQVQSTAIANKIGDLTLGEVECTGRLEVPIVRRRTGGVFDEFFNDPFFGPRYELRAMKIKSDPVAVRAMQIPSDGRPPSFTGAVGQFTMTVAASPTNVAVGEPIRVKLRIEGKGALENINPPSLESWADFTTYPPVSEVESTDPLGVEGARVFQYDVVPQKLSIRALPEIEFSYFDPDDRTYHVLKHAAVPIVVRPVRSGQTLAAVADGANQTEPGRDIVHLKARIGVCSLIGPPLILRPWFMAVQAAPLILWLGAYGWRKRREHLARNPHLVRRQEVSRTVRRGLRQLSRFASEGDSEQFFALAFRLLQEQIGERLGLPAAAITDAVVEEQLKPRGAPPELLDSLTELFHACNQHRYAPSASSADLEGLLAKLHAALKQVHSLKLTSN